MGEATPVTLDELRGWRADIATRITAAETRGADDPITHRLNEYRACVAELDAWIESTLDNVEEPK